MGYSCLVQFKHRVGRVLSFFSSRRNWDSPNPSPAGECALPPGSGGGGTLAGERGVGRVPIPTRRHTLWYSLYRRTLWVCEFVVEEDDWSIIKRQHCSMVKSSKNDQIIQRRYIQLNTVQCTVQNIYQKFWYRGSEMLDHLMLIWKDF